MADLESLEFSATRKFDPAVGIYVEVAEHVRIVEVFTDRLAMAEDSRRAAIQRAAVIEDELERHYRYQIRQLERRLDAKDELMRSDGALFSRMEERARRAEAELARLSVPAVEAS